METKRVIKFTVEKCTKRPKKFNETGTLFGLFIPETLKIQPNETKKVLLNFNVYILNDIFAIKVLLRSLHKEDLVLKNYQYKQENIRKVELELYNKTNNNTFDSKNTKKGMLHDYKRRKQRISCKICDSLE